MLVKYSYEISLDRFNNIIFMFLRKLARIYEFIEIPRKTNKDFNIKIAIIKANNAIN